ncbi:hypothetical protein H072_2108 [Dactylellina haptotyla CBS 200.50]|uniref:Apple domain-containing protein n=1 Tax=Dactylellina haptotyla (strain CBS 200.50) TaxID=1284197 RepID=S8BWN5_DACHA|nr:hypothetical protein H072_2108 [Dactylellina haptotyla CBS 200.50]
MNLIGVTSLAILSLLGTTIGSPVGNPQEFSEDFFEDLPDAQATGAPYGTETGGPFVDRSTIVEAVVAQATATDAPGADPALTATPNQPTESPKFCKRTVSSEAITPGGYFLVFSGLSGATQASSYLTFHSIPAYNPDLCATRCDSIVGCRFFNLYIERNASGEVIKCSFYSLKSTTSAATNVGQFRNGFHVTINNSNGYAKYQAFPAVEGFAMERLRGSTNGKRLNLGDPDPYMGYTSIQTSDPSICAIACEQKTAYNSRHLSPSNTYRACNFFNFYSLNKNGEGYMTICSFYLIPFNSSYATNHGYSSGGNIYTIAESYGYTRNLQQGDGGIVTV